MYFRYEIPEHLQCFLENIPEDVLQDIMTFMFELAVKQNLLKDLPVEGNENKMDLTNLDNQLTQMFGRINTLEGNINTILETLIAKIENINVASVPSEPTYYQPAHLETVSVKESAFGSVIVVDDDEDDDEGYVKVSKEEKSKILEKKFLEDALS